MDRRYDTGLVFLLVKDIDSKEKYSTLIRDMAKNRYSLGDLDTFIITDTTSIAIPETDASIIGKDMIWDNSLWSLISENLVMVNDSISVAEMMNLGIWLSKITNVQFCSLIEYKAGIEAPYSLISTTITTTLWDNTPIVRNKNGYTLVNNDELVYWYKDTPEELYVFLNSLGKKVITI